MFRLIEARRNELDRDRPDWEPKRWTAVNAARTFLICAEVKFPRLSSVSISRPADREDAFSAAARGVAVALPGTVA
jgi:hypothetical protein